MTERFEAMPNDDRSAGVPGDVPMNAAARLRAAADGELSSDQLGELDASQPELSARVDFERALRAGVSRAMREPLAAPAALRHRVRAAIATQHEENSERGLKLRPLGQAESQRWLPRWAGLAAALLLTAGVVFMGWSYGNRAGWFGPPTASELAVFVSDEHELCSKFSDHFNAKFTERALDHAEAAAAEILGGVPPIIKMPVSGLSDGGYQFVGIGRCAVPGKGDSAHMIFADGENANAKTISLFIQVDTDQLPLDSAFSYGCPLSGSMQQSPVIWREGGFLFYLFADDPGALKRAEEAFKVPKVQHPMS